MQQANELTDLRTQVAQLSQMHHGTSQRLQTMQQRYAEAEPRVRAIESKLRETQAELAATLERLADTSAELQETEQRRVEMDGRRREAEARRKEADARRFEQEQKLATSQNEVATLQRAQQDLELQVSELIEERDKLLAEMASLRTDHDADLARHRSDKDSVARDLSAAKDAHARAQEEIAALTLARQRDAQKAEEMIELRTRDHALIEQLKAQLAQLSDARRNEESELRALRNQRDWKDLQSQIDHDAKHGGGARRDSVDSLDGSSVDGGGLFSGGIPEGPNAAAITAANAKERERDRALREWKDAREREIAAVRDELEAARMQLETEKQTVAQQESVINEMRRMHSGGVAEKDSVIAKQDAELKELRALYAQVILLLASCVRAEHW